MKLLDWIILLAVAVVVILAVRLSSKNRKAGGCCGNCMECDQPHKKREKK
jgi:hypothetical protein